MISTYGYYADPRQDRRREKERLYVGPFWMTGKRSTVAARNPLTLSGVMLSGALLPAVRNRAGVPVKRGWLTGEKVAELDLSNTELVVLSACQTGLGNVVDGEGVFGLQRALCLGGARTVVASLWNVPDDDKLMPRFHAYLWGRKHSRLEALRQAQLATLKGLPAEWTDLQKANYWGAWSLSGDPGDLLPVARAPKAPEVTKPEPDPVPPPPTPEPTPKKPLPTPPVEPPSVVPPPSPETARTSPVAAAEVSPALEEATTTPAPRAKKWLAYLLLGVPMGILVLGLGGWLIARLAKRGRRL